jgi:pSer/pThr/pTyr-binding forkhead associated (FHA) protein
MASSLQKFTIGRDKSCDVAIADDSVSRLHAELVFLTNGKLSLTDRGSSNGTLLIREGKSLRIKQETVVPSDRVRFGAVELAVKDLVDAIRRKYPSVVLKEVPGEKPGPADFASAPRPDRLLRCGCGAIKPANEPCPACGE